MVGSVVLAGVLAVGSVVVAVTQAGGSARPRWLPPASAARPADPLQPATGGSAGSPVRVFVRPARPGWRLYGSTWVTRRPLVLSAVQRAVVNARDAGYGTGPEAQRYYDFLTGLDPVSPGMGEVDLGFFNAGNTPVTVQNLRVFDVVRRPSLQGTLWCDGAGWRTDQNNPLPRVLFDLDDKHPKAGPYTTAARWPAVRTVKPGELADVHVFAQVDAYDVKYRVAVDVVAAGRRVTVKLDDDGRPFEVTGWLDRYGGQWQIKNTGRHFHGGYYVQQFRDADHNPGYVRAINPATFKLPRDPGTNSAYLNVCT
jgi:hypothetical protein